MKLLGLFTYADDTVTTEIVGHTTAPNNDKANSKANATNAILLAKTVK